MGSRDPLHILPARVCIDRKLELQVQVELEPKHSDRVCGYRM